MSKRGSVIFGVLVGGVFGYIGGGMVAIATNSSDEPIRRLGRWAHVCGFPAGGYVGGVVGLLVAARKSQRNV